MANLVEYVKTVWENGKTALNAARMNNMEKGISNCATQINKLGDSVSNISYETPCSVHFLNADNRLGLRLTDPSTNNSAIIAVTTENKLNISFKINGEWLTKFL